MQITMSSFFPWIDNRVECETWEEEDDVDSRIIGGSEVDSISTVPYQVALKYKKPKTHIMCGATILNEYFIVTAGHCAM